jgi:hypothetical protein
VSRSINGCSCLSPYTLRCSYTIQLQSQVLLSQDLEAENFFRKISYHRLFINYDFVYIAVWILDKSLDGDEALLEKDRKKSVGIYTNIINDLRNFSSSLRWCAGLQDKARIYLDAAIAGAYNGRATALLARFQDLEPPFSESHATAALEDCRMALRVSENHRR